MKKIIAAVVARFSSKTEQAEAGDSDYFETRLRSMTAPAARNQPRHSPAPVLFRREMGHA